MKHGFSDYSTPCTFCEPCWGRSTSVHRRRAGRSGGQTGLQTTRLKAAWGGKKLPLIAALIKEMSCDWACAATTCLNTFILHYSTIRFYQFIWHNYCRISKSCCWGRMCGASWLYWNIKKLKRLCVLGYGESFTGLHAHFWFPPTNIKRQA